MLEHSQISVALCTQVQLYGRGRELWCKGGPWFFEAFDGLDIVVYGKGLEHVSMNQASKMN